ncbi:MAG: phospholipase D-like domain-containing protein [Actinomycetaceae bacterium]|nr:phospholipase D-like domain-containing protein [Arcanobacterium sp.]MDD7687727.1 phospholipase D-like domain-containing protein [Actinomycetaceae bacterium]MDY5274250.1 phospholipase D-like domain-containing protein [Arcanobacterium sp.]
MWKLHKPAREALISTAKWTGALILSAQAFAISTIVAIDENRKRRNPPSGEFPHHQPLDAEVSPSSVRIYTYGEDLYRDQLQAIRAAHDHIFFEMFIMKADRVGTIFREELIAAALRGVQVYIIIDTFGNLNQPVRFRHFPNLPTLHVIRFPLIRPGILTGNARKKGRDHRKILCVDSTVGFVGGYNVGDLYAHHWRDTHMRIEGPQVWELENAFIDMWNMYYHHKKQPALPDFGSGSWASNLRASVNTPAYNSYPVRALYLEAIDRASERVWITMAYFIPDDGIKQALMNAARRGVDVRVLLPEYSNHIVADWVGRPHYTELLHAGVRIFLYEQAMVHAKTMTVDSIWSTVGTTNIDRLSMKGNFEINIEMYDADTANALEQIFDMDLTNAHELKLEVWERRGLIPRIGERLLKPFGALL